MVQWGTYECIHTIPLPCLRLVKCQSKAPGGENCCYVFCVSWVWVGLMHNPRPRPHLIKPLFGQA